MENGTIDYLSFVRGFAAAVAAGEADIESAVPTGEGAGVDAHCYDEGFKVGSQPVERSLAYRELSMQDPGGFSGMLEVSADDLAFESRLAPNGGRWDRPLDQSRGRRRRTGRDLETDPGFDQPMHLSGTLDLG